MIKTVHSMKKNSLARQLYERVKEGEQRTISEWAEEFNVFPSSIMNAMGRLRKLNSHIHPVYTVAGFKNAKKGVVVDIMEKEEWFQEVYERGMKNRVIPSIKDFYKKTETAIGVFPRLKHSLTIAFNTVFSYLKASHDIMRLSAPKEMEVGGTAEQKQEILETIIEQVN